MITLKLKNGTKHLFNLKSFDREKSLKDAWYSMSGDEKFADRKLKITMDTGIVITPRISEIEDVVFEESEYCRTSRVGSVNEDARTQKSQERIRTDTDKVQDFIRRREDRNIDFFMKELRKQGIDLDLDKY